MKFSAKHAMGLGLLGAAALVNLAEAQTAFSAFPASPGVISQIQTVNNEIRRIPGESSAPFLTVATNAASATGVRFALERSESSTGQVARNEQIGFIAFQPNRAGYVTVANGTTVRWSTQLTGTVIRGWDNGCSRVRLRGNFESAPVVVASMMTRRAADGGWLRRCALNAQQVGLTVDEDQHRDNERSHVPERAALFNAARPFAARIQSDADTSWQLQFSRVNLPATRTQSSFRAIRFAQPFDVVPVVVALGDSRGSDPSAVRIRNVTRTGFQMVQVEPAGENGDHPVLGVHYVAVTPGAHQFNDGTPLVAGIVNTRQAMSGRGVSGTRGWASIRFHDFASTDDGGDSPAVDAPPQAALTASPVRGTAPLTVAFDSSPSTDDVRIDSTRWNFGDGTGATGTNPTHEYSTPGTYTAALIVTDSAGQTSRATQQIVVQSAQSDEVNTDDASRFLHQATFGPTLESIAELERLGIDRWLDRQFALRGPTHLSWVMPLSYSHSHPAGRHEVFWRDVLEGEDQLRQRVAFALSEIFVVSDVGVTLAQQQYAMTRYYDHLRNNAFGNYRNLLETVTLSPVMGLFLSMGKNEKANAARNVRPDENYAREVLQLFSVGMHQMRLDGTYPLDEDGQRIPVYNQTIVKEFARVFTGWHFAEVGSWDRSYYHGNMLLPMSPFEAYHDRGAKRLLRGEQIPAGLSARADLRRALDNIFNHPNVGPFISKQLIQRLVTSNPSPQYVARVARVFNNNGANVRGDLKAVIRAILTDPQARTRQPGSTSYGKLREPILRLSNIWRAFDVRRGTDSDHGEYHTVSPAPYGFDDVFGQAPLQSPSVFNFFSPSFSPAGPVRDANIVAPEFQIATETSVLDTTAFINTRIQRFYLGADANSMRSAHINLNREINLARNPAALLDHLDTLLMGGSMPNDLRAVLLAHLEQLPSSAEGLTERARDAVSLIVASPDYLIQQ